MKSSLRVKPRAYGNENGEIDELGCMNFRYASINDLPNQEAERKFRWERKAWEPV